MSLSRRQMNRLDDRQVQSYETAIGVLAVEWLNDLVKSAKETLAPGTAGVHTTGPIDAENPLVLVPIMQNDRKLTNAVSNAGMAVGAVVASAAFVALATRLGLADAFVPAGMGDKKLDVAEAVEDGLVGLGALVAFGGYRFRRKGRDIAQIVNDSEEKVNEFLGKHQDGVRVSNISDVRDVAGLEKQATEWTASAQEKLGAMIYWAAGSESSLQANGRTAFELARVVLAQSRGISLDSSIGQ